LGVITRTEAHRLHASDLMLREWVRDGVLVREHRNAFRLTAAPTTPEQRVLLACLPAHGHASHLTAAALHRFDGCPTLDRLPTIDLLVPLASNYRSKDARVHRSPVLEAIDRCHVGPIPATSPLRTLIDLGAVAPLEQVEEALDGAERDGKVKRHVLERRVAHLRASGRNGVATIATILEQRAKLASTPTTVLERRFFRILQGKGLPLPVAQHAVQRLDERGARLDFAYTDRKIAIELQSTKGHATPEHRASDYERSNRLPNWRFVQFTYEDVMRRPGYVASVMRTFCDPASVAPVS
jgi:hypothetical protein